jgi:hypothetical protein
MQCTRCFSKMRLVKRENHQASQLEWHQCPLCDRKEFLSHPIHHELDLLHYLGSTSPLKPAMR